MLRWGRGGDECHVTDSIPHHNSLPFTSLDGRYRAMFNFLEYPRLVVTQKEKQGPVLEVAFSTQHPDELMQLVLGSAAARHAA